MDRTAQAVWQGGLKDGKGTVTTASKVLDSSPYGFASRFEQGQGTNPEELIAAAHAGCFSMALSLELEKAGFKPQRVETKATVSLEKSGDGFAVTRSRLQLHAQVAGIGQEAFDKAANSAKEGCPVSKLLQAEITLEAHLEK